MDDENCHFSIFKAKNKSSQKELILLTETGSKDKSLYKR